MNKLTKTDHYEQSLPIDPETSRVLREACKSMIDYSVGSIEMRATAVKIYSLLSDPDREDKPAIFLRTPGNIINCPDCAGSGLNALVPEDRNLDTEFNKCKTCKGTGQLFQEVIRKMYVPEEYHRRKLAK